MNGATARTVAVLARRSVRRIARQPQVLVPNLFFPVFLLIINAAALGRATTLAGFPAGHYLDFVLPGVVVQAAMLTSTAAGAELAADIQTGFFERLLTAPVRRWAILVGHLAGVAVAGAVLALAFGGLAAVLGTTMAAGVAGYATLAVAGALVATGFGALAAAVGIKTGSVEAVHGTFPLYFVAVVVSSAYFPVALMRDGYRPVAQANPLTWLLDAARRLTVEPAAVGPIAICLAVGAGFAFVGLAVAEIALARRLARR